MIEGYWGGRKLCSAHASSSLTSALLHWVGPSNQLGPLDCEQECCVWLPARHFLKPLENPRALTPLWRWLAIFRLVAVLLAWGPERGRWQHRVAAPHPCQLAMDTQQEQELHLSYHEPWGLMVVCDHSRNCAPHPSPSALYPTQMAPWKRACVSSDKLADMGNLVSDAKCYYLVRSLTP